VVIVTVVVWDVKSARGVIWLGEKLILVGYEHLISIVCVLIVMVVVWDAKLARGEIW